MTVTKVVELVGESRVSWDDAVREAVKTASHTIHGITGVHVKNMTGNVDETGDIVEYKADIEIAFAVDGSGK